MWIPADSQNLLRILMDYIMQTNYVYEIDLEIYLSFEFDICIIYVSHQGNPRNSISESSSRSFLLHSMLIHSHNETHDVYKQFYSCIFHLGRSGNENIHHSTQLWIIHKLNNYSRIPYFIFVMERNYRL